MRHIRESFRHFFSTFSIYHFLLLAFGLPFLTEGLFLFLRQSFMNHLYQPFYLFLFLGLIFLYGILFDQVQVNEKTFQNFSLKAAFVSFAFWLVLSPLFFFRFYQLFLVWQPLPAEVLSFVFFYRWKILPLLVLLYCVVLYFLFRVILAPKYLKQNKRLKESLQLSWQRTKTSIPKQVVFFPLIPIAFLGFGFLLKIGFIWSTPLLTHQSTAMMLLLVYRVIQNSLWTFFFLYLTAFDKKTIKREAPTKASVVWLSLTVIACLGLYSLHYAHAFQVKRASTPLTISHRGVSDDNGLQNSIAALKRTSKQYQPDFVEMDVQETADHQLVVIHDEDLKALADKNLRIDETDWKDLKKIELKENGYTSKIPLFSDYLAAANQLKQRLLIELKVTAKTKQSIVQQLLPLREQLANHQLQSMDLEVANQMKKLFPILKVGYILPFDLLGSPRTSLDFVNIESRTANGDLIQALHHQKQGVYAWSVHSKRQVDAYRFQQINGLLTDDLRVFTGKTADIPAKTRSILQFD